MQYLGKPPWETGISPPELKAFIESHPAGHALDLGCGTGTNAITLAKRGWQVTAIDFIGRALSTARRKARQAGVSIDFINQDVSQLENLAGPYDLVLDIGCYHNLPELSKNRYRKNLVRLLRPGGAFLLYAFISRASDSRGFGLTEADIYHLSQDLHLLNRQDGFDRGQFSSAWFTFQK